MTTLRLRADFNGLFGKYLCLSHGDTCLDESGAEVSLRPGMQVMAFDEDSDEQGRPDNLIASGIVEPAVPGLVGHGSKWMLRIDDHGVRHESDVRAQE